MSTELPQLSPVIRHMGTPTIERGGILFHIGEQIRLSPEHYLYGDSLLEPQPIVLRMLWMGDLIIRNGIVMVAVEGVELAPVPGRKRSILADFAALSVAPPMNPAHTPRNSRPGSSVRPNDTRHNERADG